MILFTLLNTLEVAGRNWSTLFINIEESKVESVIFGIGNKYIYYHNKKSINVAQLKNNKHLFSINYNLLPFLQSAWSKKHHQETDRCVLSLRSSKYQNFKLWYNKSKKQTVLRCVLTPATKKSFLAIICEFPFFSDTNVHPNNLKPSKAKGF